MSQSKLEARLLKPALCHSFPGNPTCLAYDAKYEHIAVGFHNGKISVLCKNGQVKVLSHSEPVQQNDSEEGKKDLCKPVMLMSFCYEEKTNKTFLVTRLKQFTKVFLWSFTEKSECVSEFVGDRVSVFTWSPASSILYVGTEDGDVIKLKVNDLTLIGSDTEEPFVSKREYGQVVAVNESPNQDLVLVVFSTGVCMVKNKESGVFHVHHTKRTIVDAWWRNNHNFIIVSKTGIYAAIEYKPAARDHFVEQSISLVNTDITKARRIVLPTSGTVVAYAGDKRVPEGYDKSQVITVTMFHANDKNNTIYPFADPVVDFVLQLNKESNESLLIVLTESNILLVNPTEGTFKKDTLFGVSMLQYHRDNLLSVGYPYITPLVTCLHYCGECSKKFMAEAASILPKLTEEQSRETPELLVTGHSDGSIWLWLCYYIHESFKRLRMVVNTEDYFEEQQQKILSAVSHVKVIDSQYLLVIKESGRVLLFSLWQTKSDMKPQSQEIVLKDYQEGSSAQPEALQTLPPHFHPHHEQQKHVQLLQHVSCHYQSGCGESLEPVIVNCADHDGQMRMLAVGTEKCLVVIDTEKNMLVQVIGSEKKLLKLCLGSDRDISGCSEENCDVVCLETTVTDEEEAQQHTLWVGTKGTDGGSLGAFNLVRKTGEVLELKATRLGKYYKESTCAKGIYSYQGVKQKTKYDPADFKNDGNKEIEVTTKNIAVIMKQHFQTYQISELKENSKLVKLDHESIVWRGLVNSQGKPFIIYIYVTKNEHKLAGFCLTNSNKLAPKSLPTGCQPLEQDLFSSNGKHAIMKCSDRFYYIMDSA